MTERFNADALAKTVLQDAMQIMRLEQHKQTDPVRYGQSDANSEREVAEKIRRELDPIWKDDDKLRSFAVAAQSLSDPSLPECQASTDGSLAERPKGFVLSPRTRPEARPVQSGLQQVIITYHSGWERDTTDVSLGTPNARRPIIN